MFDAVFMIEVLEHLLPEDIDKGLSEVWRVLKPKGYLVITVPYKEDLLKNMIICPECGAVFHRSQHLQTFDESKVKKC